MQNYLHEISYIAYVLIHFYKELAIERSLLNRVGCVVAWVTWVRGLRGSNFQMGWVGYAGQNIFYLGHNFCVGQMYFCVGLWVGPKFLRRFFFFFLRGSAFCTRWDYFSILQLIVWAFFSWVSSQQILTKPCLTPLVFLGGLIEICKIDEIQWHFYERVTKFYLWAAKWPYSQRGSKYSQISLSSHTPQASFENFIHLWKLFQGKKFPKECCIMP